MAEAFVQWKGTDACFDFTCDCGGGSFKDGHSHFDGFFAYYVQCPYCGVVWEMPHTLTPTKAFPPHNVTPVIPDVDDERGY